MKTFDVFVHLTDFSNDSDHAFLMACGIARDQFAQRGVVHVLAPSHCPGCDADADLLQEDRPAIHHCREQLQGLRSLASDIPMLLRSASGYAAGTILNFAQQEEADLIVIASHQHSQFHLRLHGSVAEGVLRQAHCPVLCLRQPTLRHATPATPASKLRRVVAHGDVCCGTKILKLNLCGEADHVRFDSSHSVSNRL